MRNVSVIVPCYNEEKYIDRCVKSLVHQTIGLENLSLIFVNDASTDNTLKCLENWEKRYPENIIVINCQENHKQGYARNIGLQYADAEYISYVDADDYVSLDFLEDLYRIAKQYHPDVVAGLSVREDQNGMIQIDAERKKNANQFVHVDTLEDRKAFLQEGLGVGIWGKIYRKDFIIEHGLVFPEDIMYEDNYWGGMLMFSVSSYYIINQAYYHYVENEESTTMKNNALHHLDRLKIELMKIEEYKNRNLLEFYHDEIEYSFLLLYFVNTLGLFFLRFDSIPYEIIYDMQKTVVTLFPGYEKNPYLHKLHPIQRVILKLVSLTLNKENIDVIAESIRKNFNP